MPAEAPREYEVGYGKPPRHTRFKKGRSGNPKGKTRGSKNLSSLLSDALSEPVFVVENGRRRKITKREAMITQLVNKSAKGDPKATQIVLAMLQDMERRADPGAAANATFTEADQQLIRQLRARLQGEKE